MANELEIINNPTSTPAAVSTGYQAQNTRSLAASNGVDLSYVEAYDASTVRLRQSGAVDISGTLYAVGAQVDFTVSSAGRYFIYLADGSDDDHKTPTIGTDAGTFDAELNARYLSGGERVLNWLIIKETAGSNKLTVLRMSDPGKLAAHNEPLLLLRHEITAAGTTTWTAPRSQVYTFELQACGGDGGVGYYSATGDTSFASGGGGGGYSKISEFIVAGTVLTLSKNISSLGVNSLSGAGFTGLSSQNGETGLVPSASAIHVRGGAGGFGGFVYGEDGGFSSYINNDYPSVFNVSAWDDSRGGASFWGMGNKLSTIGGTYMSSLFGVGFNPNGIGYGAGGKGGLDATNAGSGAPGLFLIWG